jgi:hypothetical protein
LEQQLIEIFENVSDRLSKMDEKLNYLIVKADKQDNTIDGSKTTMKQIVSDIAHIKKDDFDIKQVTLDIDGMKKDISYMIGKFYNKINYLENFIEKYDKAFKEIKKD